MSHLSCASEREGEPKPIAMLGLMEPEVLGCFFDDGFCPRLASMLLRWPEEVRQAGDRTWALPEMARMIGPPPHAFGISIQRLAADAYTVSLLWNHACFSWRALTRAQLLGCDLGPLLSAMGTDLAYLLDQPILSGDPPSLRCLSGGDGS